MKILDLGCGKGAVGIQIAQSLRISVKGADLMPDFIAFSSKKAKALGVDTLCSFVLADINEAVLTETGYDCTILGAVGDVLGNPEATLRKLRRTIKPDGYVLLDDAYLRESVEQEAIRYKNYEYLHYGEWLDMFAQTGFTLTEMISNEANMDTEADNRAIRRRAQELIALHPDKQAMFEGYIQSQLNECADLENSVISVTWMLRATG